ncbi:ferritin [Pigmentiphaga daeguensis]|uniref:Ferritin n=2 Tax=Alcaligenaceae TaxID=506 RepID=A0ABN1BP87_9BURK
MCHAGVRRPLYRSPTFRRLETLKLPASIQGPIMLYPELFKSLESVRWDMGKDVPWDQFDASLLTDEQAHTIKMNAITEWSALPATEMFLRDNREDSDFSAFMSIWFYEEQKHSLVLQEYLKRFRPDMLPTEEELHHVRFEFDAAPALETLTLHFCGEIRLNHWYRRAAQWHSEPVIKAIYKLIAQDEARHAGAYLRYMRRALTERGKELADQARAAFAKIGVLMASAKRTSQALHPTNLHVNKSLFPNDTVQSRLPEPGWLDRWLDDQIQFDREWEGKVADRILHTMSTLLGRSFATVQDLNRYRKELAAG